MKVMEYWAPRHNTRHGAKWRVCKEHAHWVAALRMNNSGLCVPLSMFPTWRQAYDWAHFGWINDCA